MDPNQNEQTELLRLIWTEMKALGQNLGSRIDGVSERLDSVSERLDAVRTELSERIDSVRIVLSGRIDQTNERLDQTNERLGAVEETLHELAAQQLMLGRYVKNAADRHDGAIDELRERVTRIETTLELKR